MRAVRRIALVVCCALSALALAGTATAYPGPTDGQAQQADLGYDIADPTHWGWDNATAIGGVAGRPYIKRLSVSNGGPFQPLVVSDSAGAGNGWAPTAATIGGNISDVYAFVVPTNGCRVGQAPAPGTCYDPPNRVSVFLARWTGGGWDPNFTTTPSTNPAITSSSVIDIVIGFKAAYSSLRWTWVNGAPSYWNSTVASGVGGDIEVKFTPKTMPVMNSGGCSQIPVATCDIAQADHEYLEPSLILSMDTTLSASLAGTLFGTEGAFIGSLDGTPPNLTYGVAAPHLNANGTERRGTFYALMPESVLALFSTSVASFDPTILSVARTGDAGSFSPSWAAWNATTNGTSGEFLTISDISFSAPKFQVTRSGGGSSTATGSGSGSGSTAKKPLTVKVGKTATFAQLLSSLSLKTSAGSKTTGKVSTPKICKALKTGIKALAAGTCKGTVTITPKKGKAQKKAFSFTVTGGKSLPISLHR